MDRLQKTSRYFLEHLVPHELLDPEQSRRLKSVLARENDTAIRSFARELAEALCEKGVFERLDDSQFRDPRSGARFRFSLSAAAAPRPARENSSGEERRAGRVLRPPESRELDEIYDEVLSAIRLEERNPGAEPALARLLGLLDQWIGTVEYKLYCFAPVSEIPEAFAEQIYQLEPETLDAGHPFRQAARRKAALQFDAADPSFLDFPPRKTKSGTVYLLPIFIDGRAWGVLDIHLPQGESDAHLEGKLQLLTSALTHQVYNHRILSKVVFVDWTTQVYNRTFLEIQLPLEMEKARRNAEGLALLVLDLDDFKAVNDRWGHDRGDQVLREFAEVLKKTLRRVDLIFRFGGEEFVVLLPRLGREGAMKAAERLGRAIRENDFIADVEGGPLRLSASIGGAVFPDDAEGESKLFRLADEACYRAKREGKDRVVFHEA